LVGLACALAASAAGGLSFRANRAALARVDVACAKLAVAEQHRTETWRKTLLRLFDDRDREKISTLLEQANHTRVCTELRAELGKPRWNFGRTWQPTPGPRSVDVAELQAMLERMRPRCEAMMKEFLATLDGLGPVPDADRRKVLETCDADAMRRRINVESAPPAPRTLLDDWPAALEKYAGALETASY
jgi:hypothetical protein